MTMMQNREALWNEQRLIFPSFLPDETLYSWTARVHRLSGHSSPKKTSLQLFGHPSAGLRHDIPFNLSELAARTGRKDDETITLLKTRTLFGFHARFLSAQQEELIFKYLWASRNSTARGLLGLTRSGLNLDSPLKWCRDCLEEQTHSVGTGWWQLIHQLPTAFLCTSHGNRLRTKRAPPSQGAINGLCLPTLSLHAPSDSVVSPSDGQQLLQLSNWGITILGSHGLHLSDAELRWCCLMQAKSRGWVSFDGKVRLQRARDAFLLFYGQLLEHLGKAFCGDIYGQNAGFLGHSLHQPTGHRHALKNVLLLNFFFESFEEFQDVHREVLSLLNENGARACEERLRDNQQKLIHLVSKSQISVEKAASVSNTSTTSATKFLDRIGIRRKHRSRIVGTEKEKQLCQLLAQGVSRKEAANAIGVRRTFIKDYLGSHPEQKECWEATKRQLETISHRKQFLAALHDHPDLPIKSIRRLPQNGFQWLYNNDREWLREVLPAIWQRT